MNKFIGIGRLTKDPELRYTQSEKAVANFDIAINRSFSNKDGKKETDFFKVIVWNKQAENIKKYCKKGNQIAVEGEMQNRSYENEAGQKVNVTEIMANNIEFLTPKNDNQQQERVYEEAKPIKEEKNDPYKEFAELTEKNKEDYNEEAGF